MNFIKQNMQSKNNYRFNGIFILFYLTIILFTLTCNGTSREDYLNGEFGTIDATPPEILAPINNSKVTGIGDTEVALVWTAKVGAVKYTVEIVKDDNSTDPFSNSENDIVTGNPFTVNAPDTLVKVTLPDAWSYKWRVRADITEEGMYSTVYSFHAFSDSVYVYCSSSETTCSDTGKTGNKSFPYQTINGAITKAKSLGLKVKVAARGFGVAYNQIVNLVSAVSVYGGFTATIPPLAADFDDKDRNVTSNVTKIDLGTDSTFTVTAIGIDQTVVFDGFVIQGGPNYAFYAAESDNTLTVSNCTITGGNTSNDGYTHAVYLSLVEGSVFENNLITGGNNNSTGDSFGIRITSSSPVIRNNIIIGGDTSGDDSRAIESSGGGSPIIKNNTIIAGAAGGAGKGSYCIENLSTTAIIKDNILVSVTGTNRYGISGSTGENRNNCIWTNVGTNYSGGASAGTGEILVNPQFITGPKGDYYLSQTAAGQGSDSPCINAGSDEAENLGYDTKTTRTDETTDSGLVDMGYHYE